MYNKFPKSRNHLFLNKKNKNVRDVYYRQIGKKKKKHLKVLTVTLLRARLH